MLSHRLRVLGALVPVLALAGLLVASPSLAAQSLRITSPVSGTTVSGLFDVTGTADGDASAEIAVALAPQTFGDCAAPVLERDAVVDAAGGFVASIPSAAVADGVYCVIVTLGNGRLSTAVGDVTVRNASNLDESLEGPQLPTESLDDETVSTDAALAPLADTYLLAPLVVGAAATLALIVLVLALLQRRRSE
ncbi:hypothetical protein [Microcella sp.]|uniref:hypothetical protein n=1 Tax=Microcella sp. TaxID=1913979 RepID=UPI00255FE8D7|nr:hypothetical protein [Microcella sp.]MBX9472316.1 hypothetical protein [Microcella sp.]